VSFVICFLFGLICLSYVDYVDTGLLLSLIGAGLFTALIGFLDDHGHVPARWRLLGHFIAAAWGLYWLGGVPPIRLMGLQFEPSFIGQILALIYLVWMLNLYNFMDGIDGIASVQAICACVGGGGLLYLKSEPLLAIYPLRFGIFLVLSFLWGMLVVVF
jgi:Fuc2NAc and GlcNAc transferase